jgi:putative ABC transport system permease protein
MRFVLQGIATLFRRIRAIVMRRSVRRDLDDELSFHIEMLERDRAAVGRSPREAHFNARKQFGRTAAIREESLRTWHFATLDAIEQDAAFAFRMLRRDRMFAVVAVSTLAIAIGLATAMAAIVDGVVLRAMPVRDEGRIVMIEKRAPADASLRPFAVVDLLALQQNRGAFADAAGVQYDGAFPYPMRDGDRVRSVVGSIVSSGFFQVLGMHPAAGRLFERGDGVDGAPVVAVISYGFWKREYGGDPNVVGRTVHFIETSPTIVGVAPAGFEYPNGVELWVAMRFDRDALTSRSVRPFAIIARLDQHADIPSAQAAATSFVRAQEADYGIDEAKGQHAVVVPLRDAIVGNAKSSIIVLSVAVSLLFVLAAVNVANLFLVRATVRQQEMAMRGALGARRGRLLRQLVTESAVVAICASALGSAIAYALVRVLVRFAPEDLPRLSDVRVDARALLFSLLAGGACALVAGLLPALWIVGRESVESLRAGARAGRDSVGTRRLKNVLVASQVSLGVLLVSSALVLARKYTELATINPGYAGSRMTLVSLAVPAAMATPPTRELTFFEELAARVSNAPLIESSTPVMIEPFTGSGGWDATYSLVGQGSAEAERNPTLDMQVIAPGYFAAMGVPLLRGRDFESSDRDRSLPVAILSANAASRAWPGKEALGRRIKTGPPSGPEPWRTVVGIALDTRYRDLSRGMPMIYLPYAQDAEGALFPRYLAVRSAAAPSVIRNVVRTAAAQLDASALVVEARPFSQLMSVPLARPRLNAALVALFSLVALLLAAVGLYGTLASTVIQRTPELGIRMALGAKPAEIRKLIVASGLRVAIVGIVFGVIATIGASSILRSVVSDVPVSDPWLLVLVTAVLFATCAVACLLPGLRASRIDPMLALRNE